MKKPGRPMGIMASFAKVAFKLNGQEVFSANVTSGGCFGPAKTINMINEGYEEMLRASHAGGSMSPAFNAVVVRGKEYAVNEAREVTIDGKAQKINGLRVQ